MSESISAKIERMNPKPEAEVARRIYEKWKAEQEQQSAATSSIEELASEAEKEVKQEKNKEKAENKKKNKAATKKK